MQPTQNSSALASKFPNKQKKDVCGQNITLSLAPIINDPQHLQLCAVHTINNLLQILNNSTDEAEGYVDDGIVDTTQNRLRSDDATRLVLVQGNLYTQSKIEFASKKELDTIADEMSKRELLLMNGGKENDNGIKGKGQNLWKSLFSNHRTIITGNFSYEVLEAALSERGVDLSWFNVKNDTDPSNLSKSYSAKDEDISQVIIGYVINSVKETNQHFAKSLAHYTIPSIFSGRHWSVITKIRVVQNNASHDKCLSKSMIDGNSVKFLDSNSGETIDYKSEQWYMVDSESFNAIEIKNDLELLEVLRHANEKNRGNVFQAVARSLQKISV